MKRRAWVFVLIAIAVVAGVAVVLNLTLSGSRYDSAVPVRTETASRGRLEDRVTGNGSFKPRDTTTVTPEVSGVVSAVHVRLGERVGAGQLLVSLRDDDYRLARDRAVASLETARRGVAQTLVTLRAQYRSAAAAEAEAKRTFDRNQSLLQSKAISEDTHRRSQDALESARVALESAREQLNLRAGYALDAEPPLDASRDAAIIAASPEVEQADLAVRSADDNLKRCSVVAPVGGTVTLVSPSVGDVASPSLPLVRIESLGDMLAEVQIDEVDVGKLVVGLEAEVSSDSLIGTTLRGVVETIAPTITALGSTRASVVEVRITGVVGEEGGVLPLLRAGASCSARIRANVRDDVLRVSLAAFFTEEELDYVYLLKTTGITNRAGVEVFELERRQIRTGPSDVTFVEVVEGLVEGDRIVTGNTRLLREGVMVTIREATAG